MEETAHHEALERWAAIWAIFFAVLAGIAGILGQGAAQAALQLQGKANLDKVEMTDQWAFFQSRRIKMAVYETYGDLLQRLKLGALPPGIQDDMGKWKREDQEIQKKAAALQRSAEENARAAEFKLDQNDRFDICTAFLQIAIAIVSITVLIKKKWTLYAGVALGLSGAGIFVSALLMRLS